MHLPARRPDAHLLRCIKSYDLLREGPGELPYILQARYCIQLTFKITLFRPRSWLSDRARRKTVFYCQPLIKPVCPIAQMQAVIWSHASNTSILSFYPTPSSVFACHYPTHSALQSALRQGRVRQVGYPNLPSHLQLDY